MKKISLIFLLFLSFMINGYSDDILDVKYSEEIEAVVDYSDPVDVEYPDNISNVIDYNENTDIGCSEEITDYMDNNDYEEVEYSEEPQLFSLEETPEALPPLAYKNDPEENPIEEYRIIPIEELCYLEELEGFVNLTFEEQMDKLTDVWQDNWVLEVKQGLEVPLNPTLKGDFFHLEPENNFVSICIDKTFYMRLSGEEDVLLSTDLINWTDIEDFFTGRFDVTYLVNQEKLFANLLLELNQR